MKRVLFTLMISLVVMALAAQNATPVPAVNKNAPTINFEKTTHDYGTVVKGGDGVCEFKFKNTGKNPLVIKAPIEPAIMDDQTVLDPLIKLLQ